MTGYKRVWNSWITVVNDLNFYKSYTSDRFPKIKQHLRDAVSAHLPNLPEMSTLDKVGDSYDLDLLLAKLIEHKLGKFDLKSIGLDMNPSSELEYEGGWELRLRGEGLHSHVLLRSHNKGDQSALRKAAEAFLANADFTETADDISKRIDWVEENLQTFRTGLRDSMNRIELGELIEGRCELCKEWDVVLSRSRSWLSIR
jgi:hypothetical protein